MKRLPLIVLTNPILTIQHSRRSNCGCFGSASQFLEVLHSARFTVVGTTNRRVGSIGKSYVVCPLFYDAQNVAFAKADEHLLNGFRIFGHWMKGVSVKKQGYLLT